MDKSLDRLYELLPVIYRQRDAEQGYPLQALLRIIAEQVNVVEADIDQLYENWFIETCQDWVVPYIGELIGYRPVHEAGEPGEVSTTQGRQRNKVLIPRQEVANTLRYRRRKGTLALLELLANDVAGWPARAVEFYRLLGWTQAINHLRLDNGRTADLRNGRTLDWLNTPFTELAHTVDVRRVNSTRTSGQFNPPGIGLFVWRLKSYSVTETPAYCLEQIGPNAYTFSVLGNETPLYNLPQPEPEPTHIAAALNLPIPIRRRPFAAQATHEGQSPNLNADPNKSLLIWAKDWPRKGAAQPIAHTHIIPADLSDWQYTVRRNFIAVDPELGYILFPANQLPKEGVKVSYSYAFSADMGGGEYKRTVSQAADAVLYQVRGVEELQKVLAFWTFSRQTDDKLFKQQPAQAVIEIMDSGVYTLPIRIHLKEGHDLQLRAANGVRPVIRLLDHMADRPDAFTIFGEAGSRFTLDGLLLTGRSVQVQGPEIEPETPPASRLEDLCRLTIRHSTLVPGWSLDDDCQPKRPNEPSLELINTGVNVHIEHSILGTIQVTADQVETDPIAIHISDSILDATGSDCDGPACEALGAPGRPLAHAVLTIHRSTVFGRLETHAIDLAENSIFMGRVRVGRSQRGCMRFCYISPGSRTPRRTHCQPDLVEQAVPEGAEQNQTKERERLRVRPQFNSTRYGKPTYCQLAFTCADEIRHGADDEAEMGAFHDLFQPQREANLRARLQEYTPAGTDAGLIFAS